MSATKRIPVIEQMGKFLIANVNEKSW